MVLAVKEMRYNFYDPSQPTACLAGNLPHWRQEGTTYFITFRLADSLPRAKLAEWLREREEWLLEHPEPHTEEERAEFWERFPARFHRWLDTGYGSCVLSDPRVSEFMERVLLHFDCERYHLGEHVVMPNHVHATVTPVGDHRLSGILHAWKSYSAKQINKRMNRRGQLWQRESFDHIVRSAEQLERINQYIRDNPKGIT
ncbi:MAG: hypothetical protein GXP25_02755 [Planctomycetes bacterium]|nr:hypothetical protein [Planctomycetota bacterium]